MCVTVKITALFLMEIIKFCALDFIDFIMIDCGFFGEAWIEGIFENLDSFGIIHIVRNATFQNHTNSHLIDIKSQIPSARVVR
jgi:hypothetical protein